MKRNFLIVSLLTIATLMFVFSASYAQCNGGYLYGNQGGKNAGSCKSGFAIVKADANGQHVAPTSALTLPTFKGGNKAMCRYINKTKVYPVTLKNQKISGTTTVQATVLADSTLADVKVVQSSGYEEFDNEALRVVNSFPKMVPATQSCEAQDMIIQIPVTFIYEEEVAKEERKAEAKKTQEQIDLITPITLYFENDRPDPHTVSETTTSDYMALYNAYMGKQTTYVTEAGNGLSGDAKTNAENAVNGFFKDSIETGYDRLVKVTKYINDALESGKTVEFTISGFASPLSGGDYNKHLSARRIVSVLNYMSQAEGSKMAPYINGQKSGLTIHRNPEGEVNRTDDSDAVRDTVYGLKAAKDRKLERDTKIF